MKGARSDAIVFLGGGRITGALLAGLHRAGYEQPIVVHDRNADKLRQLRRQHDVQVEADLHRAVEQAHLLIIAVRPDSVRELLQKIEGISLKPQYAAPREGDVRDSQADTTAARRDLGHDPQFTLEQGLRRTLAWYRAQ